MELSEIPGSIENRDLEETALNSFENLEVNAEPSSIENCHWVPSKAPKKIMIKKPKT